MGKYMDNTIIGKTNAYLASPFTNVVQFGIYPFVICWEYSLQIRAVDGCEILQLKTVAYPSIHRVLTIRLVVQDFFHPQHGRTFLMVRI